jgi:transposase
MLTPPALTSDHAPTGSVSVSPPQADCCWIQEFPAHTAGLKAIAAFLREHQVNTIALESTGIYWIPLYELLQTEGFEVLLIDPSYTHQLRGRPKTDRRDCQWIYRLHSVGLLAAAFRSDERTCQLRAYLRQRGNLVRQASKHVQHMQKALEQMNLKLTEILSDITGVTGRFIIRAILRGTRAPEKLAKYRDKQCKASEAEIAQALTGSYREEHLFELKQAYEAWQFSLRQVEQADPQIALQLGRMKCDRALPPLKRKARPKRRVNSPGFDVRTALYYVVGLDLTEIEGISELTALTLISELGPGVSQFATLKKFCSWLGLCANWKKTGGRVKFSRTRRGGEPCGAGDAFGGPESTPQQVGLGRVSAAHERAAGDAGGLDRNGAQAGTDRVPGAQARDDVRA